MRKLVCIIAFLSSTICATAQNTHYVGLFPTIDHSGEITERWSYGVYLFNAIKPYTHEAETRKDYARILYGYIEGSISYNLTKNLSFSSAYVFERQNPFMSNFRNEHRAFQQLTFKTSVKKTEWKHRLRFDERFLRQFNEDNVSFQHRIRYLSGIKRYLKTPTVYISAYWEFFFDTTPGARYRWSENWSAVLLGLPIASRHSFEIGPLYVGWINSPNKDWLHQYYLHLSWVSKFSFIGQREKKEH